MSTLLLALPYLTSVEWFLLGGMLLLLIQGLLVTRVGWFCTNSENTKGFQTTLELALLTLKTTTMKPGSSPLMGPIQPTGRRMMRDYWRSDAARSRTRYVRTKSDST